MPNDKAPGPGLFMNKFWYVVKGKFYDLCESFYNGNLNLQSLNTAYITLIPKPNSPSTATDFRPISLVTMARKILTKCKRGLFLWLFRINMGL
jgi:hypothetical protein